MIAWAEGVNKKVLRETTWGFEGGFISDETRSGKPKRRPSNSLGYDKYNVIMHFTIEEYEKFRQWFKNDLRRGALSFAFPRIDGQSEELREYQFYEPEETISFSNPDGDIIEASFVLEEVL